MSGDRSSYSGDPTHSSSYYANQAQQRDSTAQNTTMDSQCGDPSCTTCSQSAKDTIQRLSHLTYAEPEEDYLRTMQGIGKAAGKMRSSTNPSELTGASLLSHFPSENIRSFGKPLSRSRRIKNHVRGWRGKPKKYPSGTQSGLFIEEQSAGNLIKGLYSAGIVDGCQGTNGDSGFGPTHSHTGSRYPTSQMSSGPTKSCLACQTQSNYRPPRNRYEVLNADSRPTEALTLDVKEMVGKTITLNGITMSVTQGNPGDTNDVKYNTANTGTSKQPTSIDPRSNSGYQRSPRLGDLSAEQWGVLNSNLHSRLRNLYTEEDRFDSETADEMRDRPYEDWASLNDTLHPYEILARKADHNIFSRALKRRNDANDGAHLTHDTIEAYARNLTDAYLMTDLSERVSEADPKTRTKLVTDLSQRLTRTLKVGPESRLSQFYDFDPMLLRSAAPKYNDFRQYSDTDDPTTRAERWATCGFDPSMTAQDMAGELDKRRAELKTLTDAGERSHYITTAKDREFLFRMNTGKIDWMNIHAKNPTEAQIAERRELVEKWYNEKIASHLKTRGMLSSLGSFWPSWLKSG